MMPTAVHFSDTSLLISLAGYCIIWRNLISLSVSCLSLSQRVKGTSRCSLSTWVKGAEKWWKFHSHSVLHLPGSTFSEWPVLVWRPEQKEGAVGPTCVFSVHMAAAVSSNWFWSGGQVTMYALVFLKYFCYCLRISYMWTTHLYFM